MTTFSDAIFVVLWNTLKHTNNGWLSLLKSRNRHYGFTKSHLLRLKDNNEWSFHISGMRLDKERIQLSIGGDMTIAGDIQ